MKKALSILLALTMAITILPAGFIMASALTDGDFTYEVTGSNATVTGYTGAGGAVNIPATVGTENYPVTSIGANAFYGNTLITSVVIPNTVTTIGFNAFRGCSGLTSLAIPDSVTSIGYYAFCGCTGMTSVSIGSNVTTIEHEAFNSTGLISVTIPDNVTSISYSQFAGCTSLKSVIIGRGLTTIGSDTFNGCTSLTSVTIPDSVTNIEYAAFRFCSALTTVTLPNTVTLIGYRAFQDCSGLTSVNIPGSVTSIGYEAFRGCRSLKSLTIPNSVTTIDYYAFQGCTGLTSVSIGSNVTTIGQEAFNGCTGLLTVTIPNSVTLTGCSVFAYCTSLTSVIIGSGLTTISHDMFNHCTSLTSITIPDTVTSIEYQAFFNCSGLNSAYFNGNAPSMGVRVFDGCTTGFKVRYWYEKSGFSNPWYSYETVAVAHALPQAPVNLISTGKTDTTVSLSWNASAETAGYNVYFGATKLNDSPITFTTYTATGLTPNTTYEFTVTAENEFGESPESTAISVTTKISAPAAPTGLVSPSNTGTTVDLSWSAAAGATGYIIYLEGAKLNTSPITGTSYTAAGLAPNTACLFTVTAVNVGGESPASSPLSVTTDSSAPSAPSGLASPSKTDSTVDLSWKAVAGATGYNIYKDGIKVNGPPITATAYMITGLILNTIYTFTVTAVNAIGESSASTPLSVTANYATTKTYTTDAEFNLGLVNNTVITNDEVKLNDTTAPFNFIWVAVSSKGTIVKINTKTGEVLGEYKTAPDGQPKNPSRTTVDKNGSVWVTNRDSNTVTRVCLPESGLWVDRNGNGKCDTSTGLNDIKAWAGSVISNAADECIINYVAVSSSGTRHVSIDEDNNVWVSGIGNQIFDKIDGVTGAIIRTEGPAGYGGYGGLIDKNGVIWSSTPSSLLRWDTSKPLSGPNGGNWNGYDNPGYGLAIDKFGNVWNSSYYDSTIRKYAPDGTLLGSYNQGSSTAKGCVADGNGDIWVAYSGGSTVGHLRNDGTYVGTVQVASGPTGVAVDADGYIWVTSFNDCVVQRINPSLNGGVGAVDFTSVPLGGNLYNYSDMTGSTLKGAPNTGSWSVVYDSAKDDTKWGVIDWHSVVAGNGKLDVLVASSTDGSTFGTLIPVTNGSDFSVADGRYLKVVVNFTRATDGNKESPVLNDLTINQGTGIAYSSTITFNSAGGSAVAPLLGNIGDEVVAPANPTKLGFTFSGWDPALPVTFPEGGLSVTAQWTAKTFAAGDIIEYGSYPQTKVTSLSLLAVLNTRPLQGDSTVTYGGSKYKRVFFSQYTTYYGESTTSPGDTLQDDNGYYINTVYWFKFEPLQWRVLSDTNGELFVMADKILDSKAYNQVYTNVTWETCTMRSWLNDDFYNTAFNSTEQARIKTSTVVNADNPSYGTEGGNNTNDKLFLLSYADSINTKYGFSSSFEASDTARQTKGTDFSKSNGLFIYGGNSDWWLRTPSSDSNNACFVNYNGSVDYYNGGYYNNVNYTDIGVRPAFKINLASVIITSKAGSGCVIDNENMVIYGLATGIDSLAGYADAAAGYELAYVPSANGFGTGTVVNVKKDGAIVESYKIVIFGDVNGDGNVDGNDAGIITEVENYNVTWDPVLDAAKIKAGELNNDGNVDGNDAGIIVEVENYNLTVDQVTGIAA